MLESTTANVEELLRMSKVSLTLYGEGTMKSRLLELLDTRHGRQGWDRGAPIPSEKKEIAERLCCTYDSVCATLNDLRRERRAIQIWD